jgi:predicted Zn-dependent protease
VLLVAVCAAGVTASIVTYVSQDRLKDAFGHFLVTQDFHAALAQVRASDSALFPSVYRDVGIAVSLVKTGHPAEAERVMAESARRSPGDVRTWVTLSRIQVTRHRFAVARASYARARELDPVLRKTGLPIPY